MIQVHKVNLILKMNNMKNLIFIFFLFASINLFGQKPRLEFQLVNGKYTGLLIDPQSNKIDTFARINYTVDLIDTLISENSISFIDSSNNGFYYTKYLKTESGWVWSKTSGKLSNNPNGIELSMPTLHFLAEMRKKRTFKIIADDKVLIKIGDKETIKDCNDFKVERKKREREYQEWLRKEEAKKQEEKKKKELKIDKKEFEKIK